jgi:8-oxo-dGTP diphosphatase
MVTVDAIVFGFFRNSVKLLLVNRAREPFKGKWALPGGFVEIDEELEDAVIRELAEETGLVNVPLEQMHTFGNVGRDPRGRQITVAFIGVVDNSGSRKAQNRLKAGDDAAEVRWFDISKLPSDMAFDHKQVCLFAIRKLKNRKIYRLTVKRRNH